MKHQQDLPTILYSGDPFLIFWFTAAFWVWIVLQSLNYQFKLPILPTPKQCQRTLIFIGF